MMKAGKYYVGDLCYVMDNDWDEVCDLTIDGSQVLSGEFNMKDGRRFALYTTMYGDGTYRDEQGREYPVDSGSIGCVRVEDITMDQADINFGQIIEFDKDFNCGFESGVIYFGKMRIDTDPTDEEFEDEEEYSSEY